MGRRFLPLLVSALALWTSSAAAQEIPSLPGRQYRGLFGGENSELQQGLQLDGRIGGGFDTNVFTTEGTLPEGAMVPPRRDRNFSQATGTLTYSLDLSRVSIAIGAIGNISRYSSRNNPMVHTYRGTASIGSDLWSGARVHLNTTASYRPYYYLPSLAAAATIEDESLLGNLDIDETAAGLFGNHTTLNGNVTFSQTISTRLRASLAYQFGRSHSNNQAHEFLTRGGTGTLTYLVGKGLSLRGGYGFHESRYGIAGERSFQMRNIDAGVNYSKALSLTRKTALTFSTGSAAVVSEGFTNYHFVGSVALMRELARTWKAALLYNRSISMDETFDLPVPIDAGSLNVHGLISRRVSVRAAVGKSWGTLGFVGPTTGLDTIYARSSIGYGINRNIGMNLDYVYFKHNFDSLVGLPPGMSGRSERQRVGVFMHMWMPFFTNTRGSR